MKYLLTLLLISLISTAAHAEMDWPIVANGALNMGTNQVTCGYVGAGTNAPTINIHVREDKNGDSGFRAQNRATNTSARAIVTSVADVGSVFMVAASSGSVGSRSIGGSNGAAIFTGTATVGGLAIAARGASGILYFFAGGDTERGRFTADGAFQFTPISASPTAVQGGMYFDSDAPPGFFVCTNGTTWVLLK